ncbi:MAG TPA: hypothetical protein VHC00_17195 [Rhizobiaceae bacterium]|nr:hypothetical protein [Rhizobiaceae bacterium]
MRQSEVEKLREKHRNWLGPLGVLGRPWLVLGSAPGPTLPAELIAESARIDINNVGRTAAALGLGRADLTIRAHRKSWTEHPDLDSKGLLWVSDYPTLWMRWQLSRQKRARVDHLRSWHRKERDAIVEYVVGEPMEGVGNYGKATNGIAAACYGLFLGVPRIVLAGISAGLPGHSYDSLDRPRRQVEEDIFVLERIGKRRELMTTEATLAAAVDMALWTPDSAAQMLPESRERA